MLSEDRLGKQRDGSGIAVCRELLFRSTQLRWLSWVVLAIRVLRTLGGSENGGHTGITVSLVTQVSRMP